MLGFIKPHHPHWDPVSHCRANLARFKVPRTVVFGTLPKTSTGKMQKYVLRDRAAGLGKP